jgi:hypothetical protein
MEAVHKRHLELLLTLLVVGIVAGTAIIVVGAAKAPQQWLHQRRKTATEVAIARATGPALRAL